VQARLKRLEDHYHKYGMRRTCEGVLVCHEHNHPHVLMLQIANAFFKLYYFSPTFPRSWRPVLTRGMIPDQAITSGQTMRKSPGSRHD